jgi:hypothetical protein
MPWGSFLKPEKPGGGPSASIPGDALSTPQG